MPQMSSLPNETPNSIKKHISKFLESNPVCAKTEFSLSELQQLSKQMANGIEINSLEIIGLYDASIADSLSGKYSGILFTNNEIFVNLNHSSKSQRMKYDDMIAITGDPTSLVSTLKLISYDGNQIKFKGISYTSQNIFALFSNIIKSVSQSNKSIEREIYYKKTVELLLDTFKELCGDSSFLRKEEISDKKIDKIIQEYGSDFSKDTILFCKKTLFFTPSFIVTSDCFLCYSFNEEVAKNKVIKFKDIKRIQYNLMPLHTGIQIDFGNGLYKRIFDGVPNAQSYSDIKDYEKSVLRGSYKSRTICYLAVIYSLIALYNSSDDYQNTYFNIEQNIKKLIEYQNDTTNIHKKHGQFFSFDFVSCRYDPNEVKEAWDMIASAKEEAKAIEAQERREKLEQILESQIEQARKQYEKQKHD